MLFHLLAELRVFTTPKLYKPGKKVDFVFVGEIKAV